jgi:DNA topoisomerase I
MAVATLVHVTDQLPGIRRVRRRGGFSYRDAAGRAITTPQTLDRIRRLAIPPAWEDVWICPRPNGHLQATGRDARGRKQHRYHPRWTALRDQQKYSRAIAFADALPALRKQAAADLALRGLTRRKVLAVVVTLLERTLIRVGNDEYARTNRSFGLTTLEDRHATISGGEVRFRFRGKTGKPFDVAIRHPRLARAVRRCRELPGSQLFQYLDERGRVRDITSTHVNAYLREAMGQAFTAKDFRTWAGTVLAAQALDLVGRDVNRPPAEAHVVRAVEAVAQVLGNTRTVCRKCYIHPAVVEAYLEGTLHRALQTGRGRPGSRFGLSALEQGVVGLLRQSARGSARRAA